MDNTAQLTRIEVSGQRFRTLDDLVLRLKGLVLVRRHREQEGADLDELEMYDHEIDSVRDQLAAYVSTPAAA
jgi:protein-tyrosine phosphatase